MGIELWLNDKTKIGEKSPCKPVNSKKTHTFLLLESKLHQDLQLVVEAGAGGGPALHHHRPPQRRHRHIVSQAHGTLYNMVTQKYVRMQGANSVI